ncbi:MAG: ABC transporter ATP-binding protein [Arachnia sp.]
MGTITATGLTWSIKGTRLVNAVDLTALHGQVVGLLGPNGSGKTSLLRLLAGLRHPERGDIRYGDVDIHSMRRGQVAQRLAVVEQDTTANADLTVRQVVELGRTPFRGRFDALTEADESVIDASLARVNITDLQHRTWRTLSGGEKQRTQLARALAQQPREILLDEPTNHLDIRHQLELLELLRALETTCVIALHDLNLAARYCDHIVMLDHGRAVAAGPPETVLTPELVRQVYEVRAVIDSEPVTGTLRVAYLGVEEPLDAATVAGRP